jgi:hypothetical protein
MPPGLRSVAVYDGTTNRTFPNPINRYSVGSGSGSDMTKNANGSFAAYRLSASLLNPISRLHPMGHSTCYCVIMRQCQRVAKAFGIQIASRCRR